MREMAYGLGFALLGAMALGATAAVIGGAVGIFLVETHRANDEIFGGLAYGIMAGAYALPVGAIAGFIYGFVRGDRSV